jgi:hypothetical protein
MNKTIAIEPKNVKIGDWVWFYDPAVASNGGFFLVKGIKKEGKLVVDLGSRQFTFSPRAKALVRRLLGAEESEE